MANYYKRSNCGHLMLTPAGKCPNCHVELWYDGTKDQSSTIQTVQKAECKSCGAPYKILAVACDQCGAWIAKGESILLAVVMGLGALMFGGIAVLSTAVQYFQGRPMAPLGAFIFFAVVFCLCLWGLIGTLLKFKRAKRFQEKLQAQK